MNLAQTLIDTTNKMPGNTAIVFYDREISYESLCQSAMRLKTWFVSKGLVSGKRIAIALPNVPEFAIAFYGALAAGLEVVSINPMYTAREISHALGDASVSLIITHPLFDEAVTAAAAQAGAEILYSDSMGDPAKPDIQKVSASLQYDTAIAPKAPRETAIIVYTNAISGSSLGACLTHYGLEFDARAGQQIAAITCEDTFLSINPLYHAFAMTVCLTLPVIAGATSIYHETFREPRVLASLQNEHVTIFPTVPTVFKKILDAYGSQRLDLSGTRAFIPGGAPPPPGFLQAFRDTFNAPVYEGYGITECGPLTTCNKIAEGISKIGSIGVALPEVAVRIVDQDGHDVPAGVDGEIIIKGQNVMEGYLNHPEATAAAIRDGWFYSGDRACFDDEGFVYFKGLIKRMMIVGGFNVYPAELEIEIAKHPAVASCSVFAIPDDNLCHRPAVEVTLRPDTTLTRVELQKFLRKSLAPYKIPKRVDIIE